MGPPNGPHMGSGNARRKKAGHWQRRASLVQTETAFARAFRGLRCQKRPPEGKGELAEPPEKTGSREERQAGRGGRVNQNLQPVPGEGLPRPRSARCPEKESDPHSCPSALGRLQSPPSCPQRSWPSPSLQSAPTPGRRAPK